MSGLRRFLMRNTGNKNSMLYITGEGIPLSASVYINKNYVKQQRAESGGRRCPVSGLGIRKGKEDQL